MHEEDLETLRAEASRRSVSLSQLVQRVLAEEAQQIRRESKPRFGLASYGGGVAEESVADEESPAHGAEG